MRRGSTLARIIHGHPAETRATHCAKERSDRKRMIAAGNTLSATEIFRRDKEGRRRRCRGHRRGALTPYRRKRSERRPESIMNKCGLAHDTGDGGAGRGASSSLPSMSRKRSPTPMQIAESATLKAGQWCPEMEKSRKSTTAPPRMSAKPTCSRTLLCEERMAYAETTMNTSTATLFKMIALIEESTDAKRPKAAPLLRT